MTLNKAMKAAKDGDADEAAFLFRLHSRMGLPVATVPTATVTSNNMTMRATSNSEKALNISGEIEKPFVENGVTFMPGQ